MGSIKHPVSQNEETLDVNNQEHHHQMQFSCSKPIEMHLWQGLCPGSHGGNLQCSPRRFSSINWGSLCRPGLESNPRLANSSERPV